MERIIGIDIDGVITDENHKNQNIWHNALCTYLGRDIERKKDDYNFTEAYNLNLEIIQDFVENNVHKIYKNVKPRKYVKTIFNKLLDWNFKIYLITARHEEYRKLTEKWLEKYNIPYHKLFHADDKATIASKLGINIFIEDNKQNTVDLLKKNIIVLLFNKYHNRDLNKQKHLYRVQSWMEINNLIIKLFNIDEDINHLYKSSYQ